MVTRPFKIGDEAAYRRLVCASGNSAHAVSDSECTGYSLQPQQRAELDTFSSSSSSSLWTAITFFLFI